MKTVKATDGHRKSSGGTYPRGLNWAEGSCCAGGQPVDGGSRAKAKGPAKRWKLSAAEHLVKRLSQALGVSAGEGNCPGGTQRAGGNGAPRRRRSTSGACVRGSALRVQTFCAFISFSNAGCVISYINNLNDSFNLSDIPVSLCFIIRINTL